MQEILIRFFSTAYGAVTAIAAGVAMLWGLFKAIGAFREWVKKFTQERREKKNLPKKMMESINSINERVNQNNAALDALASKINLMTERMNDNDDATATLMLEKMMWAYHYYILENRQIPLDTQTALCVMYDQYKKNKKHNHVPDDFKRRIMACKVVGSK